jgi:hypothetical protein
MGYRCDRQESIKVMLDDQEIGVSKGRKGNKY